MIMVQPKDIRLAFWLLEEYADWIADYTSRLLCINKSKGSEF